MKYINRLSLLMVLAFVGALVLGAACGAGQITAQEEAELTDGSLASIDGSSIIDKEVATDSIFTFYTSGDIADLSGQIKCIDEFGDYIADLEFAGDVVFSVSSKAAAATSSGLKKVYVRPVTLSLPQKCDCEATINRGQDNLVTVPFTTACSPSGMAITNYNSMMECVDYYNMYLSGNFSIVMAQIAPEEAQRMFSTMEVVDLGAAASPACNAYNTNVMDLVANRFLKIGDYNFEVGAEYQLVDAGVNIASLVIVKSQAGSVDTDIEIRILHDPITNIPEGYLSAISEIAIDSIFMSETITYLNAKMTVAMPDMGEGAILETSCLAGYMGPLAEFIYDLLNDFGIGGGGVKLDKGAPPGGSGLFKSFGITVADEASRPACDLNAWDATLLFEYNAPIEKASFKSGGNYYTFNNIAAVSASKLVNDWSAGILYLDINMSGALGMAMAGPGGPACEGNPGLNPVMMGMCGNVFDQGTCITSYGYSDAAESCWWDDVKASCKNCTSECEEAGSCVNSCFVPTETWKTPTYYINWTN